VTELAGTEAQLEYEPLDDVDAAERLPAEIEPAILRKYFSLTRADQDEVERCRGPANKLGFSVQLCTLRWRGHFLPDTRDVPPVVLEVLAPQLGLLPMLLADYPRDEKTRFSHLERIRRHLGFVRCDRVQRQHLLDHLTSVARGGQRAQRLVSRPRPSTPGGSRTTGTFSATSTAQALRSFPGPAACAAWSG